MYTNDLVLCGELEKNLCEMVVCVSEIKRKRGLKVNVEKSKMMALGRGTMSICKLSVDEKRLKCGCRIEIFGIGVR